MRMFSTFVPPKRYRVLDTYRFIAAMGIVAYHFETQFQGWLSRPTLALEKFQLFVDFFFVLSGFVLMHTYGASISDVNGFGSFIRKRLARIYPLHFVTSLGFLALAAIVSGLHIPVNNPEIFDFRLAIPTLALAHSMGTTDHLGLDYPSWSISSEFFAYMMFPFLAAVLVRIRVISALLLACGFAMAMHVVRDHAGLRSFTHASYDFGNFRALPSFFLGMVMQMIVAAGSGHRISWWKPHVFMAFIVALMLAKVPDLFLVALFPPMVYLIAAAEVGGAPTRLTKPFFAQLGDASFGLYLLHPFFAIVVGVIVRKAGVTSAPAVVVLSMAGAFFAIVGAIASYRCFERPARRLLAGAMTNSAAEMSDYRRLADVVVSTDRKIGG